jgi:hypothetical protein
MKRRLNPTRAHSFGFKYLSIVTISLTPLCGVASMITKQDKLKINFSEKNKSPERTIQFFQD